MFPHSRFPLAPALCLCTTTPPTSIPSTASPSTQTPVTALPPSPPSITPAGPASPLEPSTSSTTQPHRNLESHSRNFGSDDTPSSLTISDLHLTRGRIKDD